MVTAKISTPLQAKRTWTNPTEKQRVGSTTSELVFNAIQDNPNSNALELKKLTKSKNVWEIRGFIADLVEKHLIEETSEDEKGKQYKIKGT